MPDNWRPLFLLTLAATCNVAAACRAGNISRDYAYDQKAHDLEFAAAWAPALETAVDDLEGECYRRARHGSERLKFQTSGPDAGKPFIDPRTGSPYVEHEYSDTLTVTLLKAHRPEKYRESYKVETTSTVSNGAITAPEELVAEVKRRLPGFLTAISKVGGIPPVPPASK